VLVLRHGSPRRVRLAARLLRAAPPGAEPLGAHRAQLPGERSAGRGGPGGRDKRLEEATQADLEDSLGDILRHRSANTAATRYKVMRVLYRWLEEGEELPNPMARMKPPIIPEQPIPIVPADGLRRLLAACAGKGFEARRDTAIIMLLLDTGARRAELADLQLAHVDLNLDVLLVLGKGRRGRALPFGHRAGEALERYLRVRARHKHAELPWLWISVGAEECGR
jgi:site-specific recombinase XerD